MTAVIGLDLAVTSTGIACADGTLHTVKTKIRPNAKINDQARRLHQLIGELDPLLARGIGRGHTAIAVIEDYAHGGHQGLTMARLAEVGGVVRNRLFERSVHMYAIPPTALKKWATGNGGASKEEMTARARDFGFRPSNDDEADACLLRQLGLAFQRVRQDAEDAELGAWLKSGVR